jgi:1A family penicillin-binding protein
MPLKRQLLIAAVPIVAFLVLTPIVTYAYYARDIANQDRLMNRNNTGIVLMDKNGKPFYETGRAEHRTLVPLSDISDNVEHALVASEDKNFYHHDGFSITGIIRAFYNNLLAREVTGGGSTITQQLAKNTLLSEKRTFFRKYQELAMSVAIEQRYTKDQILDMYLNSAFFGGDMFGIDEAAETYFGKSAKDLDLAESAMLVGILPAPNAYSPTLGNPDYAKERQTTVLTRMVANGYITDEQKQAAQSEKLTYAKGQAGDEGAAPHFAQMVLQEIYKKYGEETVKRSGYQVKTTLDIDLQKQLTQNIANHMRYIQANGGSNAAGVAIDPTSGEIRALVGSADWNNADWGKVNMVTSARQPGSSFKPIYYSNALADGVITPATILHDVPTDFGGYRPLDADRQFRGDVTARTALDESLNIPSVQVMQKFGIDSAVQAAQRLGITTIDSNKNYGLSLALGAAEVPLLQMTNAYAAFANDGQQYKTFDIKEIDDKFNAPVYRAQQSTPHTAISAQGAYLISNILSDNQARAPIFGSSLTVPGRTAAVKTGTTDEQRDAWTIGYTPQLAVGVWVGNNNNDTMLNGGSGMAGPIWINTMKQALTGVPNTPFVIPAGIVQKPVCYGVEAIATRSGYGTFNEYFLASAVPTKTCTPQEPKPKEQPKETQPKQDSTDSKKKSTDTSGSSTDTNTSPTTTGGGSTNTTNTGSGGTSGTGGTVTPQSTDSSTTSPDGTVSQPPSKQSSIRP